LNELLKSKAGYLVPVLASVVLLAGMGSSGLWDPWEMNSAFLGRRMAEAPRVLVMEQESGVKGPGVAEVLRGSIGDGASIVSTGDAKGSASPLRSGRTLMADHVFSVAVIELDSLVKGHEDKKGIAKISGMLESTLPANASTSVLLVSGGGVVDAAAVRDKIIEENAPQTELLSSRMQAVSSLDQLAEAVNSEIGCDAFMAHFKVSGRTAFVPPLDPWLVSLSLRVFGQSEMSARLPAALTAIFLLFAVFWFTRRVFGGSEAALAVLVLATSPLFFGSARFVANELSTMLWLCVGVMALVSISRADSILKAAPIAVAATVLLYLSGGMTAVVTFAAIAAAYPFIANDVRKEVMTTSVAVIVTAGLLAVATFVPDAAFFRQFRFTSPTFAGGMRLDARSFDFVLKEVGFGMFPWSALLPLSVMGVVGIGRRLRNERLLLVLWALAPLVVLMMTIRPMHHYLYAGLPALAVLTAVYIREAGDDPLESRLLAFFGFGLFLAMMKDIVLSPASLISFLTTDPMFSRPGKGDMPFPAGVKLSVVGLAAAVVSGVSLLIGGGRLLSFVRGLPAVFNRGKTFWIVLLVLVCAVVIDLIVFIALKWNSIAGAASANAAVGAMLLRIFLTGPDIAALYLLVVAVIAIRHAARLRARLEALVPKTRLAAFGAMIMRLERPGGHFALMAGGAIVFSMTVMFSLVPELSYHLSQKHIMETYRESSSKAEGELYRHGAFASSGSEDSNFYTGQVREMTGRSRVVGLLSDEERRTFFIVPKKQWSEINASFRRRSGGRHAYLLDDRSSRFVLAVSSLVDGEEDSNWLKKAVVTEEEYGALKGMNATSVNFDDKVELIGYSLDTPAVSRGGVATLKMYFKCNGKVPVSYRIFMHIDRVGSSSRIHGDHWILNLVKETEDQKSCVGCFATTHWLKGDIVVDTYAIKVPIGSPSGPHNMWMGFYTPGGGKRLKVKNFDKAKVRHDGNNRVSIGILTVE